MLKLLRIDPARKRLGVGRGTFYDAMSKGLMVRPVKIGARAAAIPEYELDQIIAARIAGKSDCEVRGLVERIHAERARIADQFFPEAA